MEPAGSGAVCCTVRLCVGEGISLNSNSMQYCVERTPSPGNVTKVLVPINIHVSERHQAFPVCSSGLKPCVSPVCSV